MPTEEEKAAKDRAELTEAMKTIAEGQKTLTAFVTQQAQGQQQLTQTIASLSEALGKGLNVNPATKEDEAPNFEEMNQGQTVQFLLTELTKLNQKTTDAFETQIKDLRGEFGRDKRSSELNSVRGLDGNEDFDDFIPEMTELAKSSPGLTADQLLKLARIENPDKAKQLREDIVAKKKEEGGDKEEKDPPFTGLNPTQVLGEPDIESDDSSKPETIREGIEKAWGEVVPEVMDKSIASEGPLF